MQGKGIVKFFFAALAIVCIYQLSFTWKAAKVEKQAKEYALQAASGISDIEEMNQVRRSEEQKYLAQKATENVYNLGIVKYTYEECKERQINLGLDLQGGMSVVLEVSKYDLIKSMSNDPKNPKLISALNAAREKEGLGQGELIALFGQIWEEKNADSNLAGLFRTRDNSDELAATASNPEVIEYIAKAADEGIESTYTKLRQRIDNFGVAQPYLTLQKAQGRIIVELPGVDNPVQVRKLLQATANLEFWQCFKMSELNNNLVNANNKLKNLLDVTEQETVELQEEAADLLDQPLDNLTETVEEVKDEVTQDITDTENAVEEKIDDLLTEVDLEADSLLSEETETGDALFEDITEDDAIIENPESASEDFGPLFALLQSPSRGDGPVIGYVNVKDTFELMEYLRMDEVRAEFPPNLKFMWSAVSVPEQEDELYELYAIKMRVDDDRALLDGDVIKRASQGFDPTGRVDVTMVMKSQGAKKWQRITADNIGEHIAIVLDNKVYSAPVIQGEIPGGNSQISGNFDIKEAQALASILETGKLPVPSRIVQEDQVGPSLGRESIRTGLFSLIAGLTLVIIFMVLYYSTGGIIADIALLANIFFIFGVLASLGATLTLPGIAGIVLTVGMAVDANVIIFERIREELAKGKTGIKAISDGYQNSYSAIIDANITTLIVAFILSYFGDGPVVGFATVLIIGIISSLFTAILVTRLLIDFLASRGKEVKYDNRFSRGLLDNTNFAFIPRRKVAYMVSGTLIVLGIISFIFSGFQFGVDFKGGRTYTVKFENAINPETVRSQLQDNFDENVVVKSFSSNNKLKVTTSHRVNENLPETDSLVTSELYSSLGEFYSADMSFSRWNSEFKESQSKVEPTIAKDIKRSAMQALLIAMIAIFLYIVLRFRRWQFGLGAIVAVVHDVIIVLAIFSIFKNIMPFSMEIGETFIAAILTVIGYSINDTVVVFDRVREFIRESKAGKFEEVINAAINSTLSRTLITSLTTLIVILILFIFGSELIKGFAFAIFIGILVGTYSSIFVATPIVVDLNKEKIKKQVSSKK